MDFRVFNLKESISGICKFKMDKILKMAAKYKLTI